jgi:hypothetical protein
MKIYNNKTKTNNKVSILINKVKITKVKKIIKRKRMKKMII